MFGTTTTSKGMTCEGTREGRACHGLRLFRWKYKQEGKDVTSEVCLSCHNDLIYIKNFQKQQIAAGIPQRGVDLTAATYEEIK